MKYKEIEGDLLKLAEKGHFDVLAHDCNCRQKMNEGISLQIKNQFPIVYQIDKNDTRGPLQRLGDMTLYITDTLVIANLYTHYNPENDLNYTALRLSLYKLNRKFKGKKIGLPMIGSGFSSIHWSKIKLIIQEELKDCDITVVVFDRYLAGIDPFNNKETTKGNWFTNLFKK